MQLSNLKKQLAKVEAELNNCRSTVMIDGWQIQRHAKKSRKWDMLAIEKMELIKQIQEIEKNDTLD